MALRMAAQATRVLGDRYELRERIGTGGMASVWRADDTRLGRPVAVTLLSEAVIDDPEFLAPTLIFTLRVPVTPPTCFHSCNGDHD
jgi:hypothetical protein